MLKKEKALLLCCGLAGMALAGGCSGALPTSPAVATVASMPGRGWSAWQAEKVIAHRGYARNFPENTLEAIRSAIASGAVAVEIDVRFTADGVPILMHDPSFERTTDRRGFVSTQSVDQLRDIDACPREAHVCAVPTLRDALAAARGKARVVIDIKDVPHRGALLPVFEDIEETAMVDHVAIVSSGLEALVWVRAWKESVPVGMYVVRDYYARRHSENGASPMDRLLRLGGTEILLRAGEVTTRGEIYRAAVRRGLPIAAYTAKNRSQLGSLLSTPGVARVMSDAMP